MIWTDFLLLTIEEQITELQKRGQIFLSREHGLNIQSVYSLDDFFVLLEYNDTPGQVSASMALYKTENELLGFLKETKFKEGWEKYRLKYGI